MYTQHITQSLRSSSIKTYTATIKQHRGMHNTIYYSRANKKQLYNKTVEEFRKDVDVTMNALLGPCSEFQIVKSTHFTVKAK